jgi:hypothetical protein
MVQMAQGIDKNERFQVFVTCEDFICGLKCLLVVSRKAFLILTSTWDKGGANSTQYREKAKQLQSLGVGCPMCPIKLRGRLPAAAYRQLSDTKGVPRVPPMLNLSAR